MFWDDKYGAHGLSPEVITLLQSVTRDTLTFMRVGKGVQGFVSLIANGPLQHMHILSCKSKKLRINTCISLLHFFFFLERRLLLLL